MDLRNKSKTIKSKNLRKKAKKTSEFTQAASASWRDVKYKNSPSLNPNHHCPQHPRLLLVVCLEFSLHLSVCQSVSLSVCLPACLPACLLACLPACLPVCLSVCLSSLSVPPLYFVLSLCLPPPPPLSLSLSLSLSLFLCLSLGSSITRACTYTHLPHTYRGIHTKKLAYACGQTDTDADRHTDRHTDTHIHTHTHARTHTREHVCVRVRPCTGVYTHKFE